MSLRKVCHVLSYANECLLNLHLEFTTREKTDSKTNSQQQSPDIPSAYQVLRAEVLVENWLLTHPTDTEQHGHHFVVFFSFYLSNVSLIFTHISALVRSMNA